MSGAPRRVRLVAAGTLVALAALALVRAGLPGGALGMALAPPSAGGITVREAALRRMPTAWLLDARVELELPPAIRDGLDSGVSLEFVLELSLHEPRRLLPDRRVLEATRRYGLTYYELTRHYRVRSFDDGTGRNYRSLPTALAGLGTLRGVPLGGGTEAATSRVPLRARLALELDERALPLPLQSPLGSAWRLASEPHAWTHAPRNPS